MRDDMKSEIVKEILIDAPVAKVWLHLTDPKRIAGWLMPNDFELRVGRAKRPPRPPEPAHATSLLTPAPRPAFFRT